MAEDSGLLARWVMVRHATRDRCLSGAALAVLVAILDRIDATGVAWPSLGRIADDANTSRRNVVKLVDLLVSNDYLIRESGDRTKSNRYRMGSVQRDPREQTIPSQGREQEIPKVGNARSLEVGNKRSPELAYKNLPIEPTQEAAPVAAIAKVPRKRSAGKITLAQYMDQCEQRGEDLIPEGHHVFAYAEKVGLPVEMLEIAWEVFKSRYVDDPKPRYTDWASAFRKCAEGNWYGIWWIDADGQYQLTTKGKQAAREHDMQNAPAHYAAAG